MRLTSRAALIAAAAIPLATAAPAAASAASAGDVTYSFAVDGSTVINTITNNSGTELSCATVLAEAPGGVLPPVADVVLGPQPWQTGGPTPAGVTTQTLTDVPAGSYVILATCGRHENDRAMWVPSIPGSRNTSPLSKSQPSPSRKNQPSSPSSETDCSYRDRRGTAAISSVMPRPVGRPLHPDRQCTHGATLGCPQSPPVAN
ncbi:hypothetical protein KAREA_27260 [Prescottella equi]|nr:hypothetical protein RE9414_26420 [Prescottella equi]BDC72811.1 hypothetical protein KAREA_27260 [Prescottella equi]